MPVEQNKNLDELFGIDESDGPEELLNEPLQNKPLTLASSDPDIIAKSLSASKIYQNLSTRLIGFIKLEGGLNHAS